VTPPETGQINLAKILAGDFFKHKQTIQMSAIEYEQQNTIKFITLKAFPKD